MTYASPQQRHFDKTLPSKNNKSLPVNLVVINTDNQLDKILGPTQWGTVDNLDRNGATNIQTTA
ncbi:unnamed protein product [Arabidopsis thaliana]|uniref:Uncharacterized protein n=1 Tax=Arabidopsis thaliana TaxID=3702 RepID=A0A654FMS8_ARATH|nr:unnamed protein product [Arabidopsis thaliana]